MRRLQELTLNNQQNTFAPSYLVLNRDYVKLEYDSWSRTVVKQKIETKNDSIGANI